jgi:multidrug efflux pump subunit AcrA (membrane-fusion protein)
MKRRWLVGGGGLVLAALTTAWAWPRGGTWVAVERGDLVLTTEASGALESIEAESIGPPSVPDTWDFKISFLAPEGKEVKAGEPILGFDTDALERRLLEQRTKADRTAEQLAKTRADRELEAANAKLAVAEADSRLGKARLAAQAPAELVASRELARSRVDLAAAEREAAYRHQAIDQLATRAAAELAALTGERDAARAAVAQLAAAIASMRVAAPRDGTVIYVLDWRGEKKKVGDSCWQGQAVLELPRLDRLRGLLEVPEADAGRLAAGQTVRLRLDSRPDREYLARVSRVNPTVAPVSFQNPRRVVRAQISLEHVDPEAMRPAMRFQAKVELERLTGLLLVPRTALHDRGGRSEVVRHRWFGDQTLAPELGRTDGERVEVRGGLAAGDLLLVAASAPRKAS